MWVAIPYQRLNALVEIVGGSADANDLGYLQLLLDGSPLDNGKHLAGPGEIRLDGGLSILTFRYSLPCPPLGRHLLQARYVQGGRWSGISAALRFEIVPPTAPRIIAASQAGCPPTPLVQRRFFQARNEQIVLKLANVLPDTRVLAEIDGRPVQCQAVANGCCVELSLRKWAEPGIHRLVVRSVAESDCAITSEPSDEVLFQYAVATDYIDGLDVCKQELAGPACACPQARSGQSGTGAVEPGSMSPPRPPLAPPGKLEELLPPLQSPLRPIPRSSNPYGIESGVPDEEPTSSVRPVAFQTDQQAQTAVTWKSSAEAAAAVVEHQLRQNEILRQSRERVGKLADDVMELRKQAELDEQEVDRFANQADLARSVAARDLDGARNVRQALERGITRIHTSLSEANAAKDQAAKSVADADKDTSTTELWDGATRARRDATQAAAAVQAIVANNKRAAESYAAADVAVQRAEQLVTESTQAWREARDAAGRLTTLRAELQAAEIRIKGRLTEVQNANTQAQVQAAEAAAKSIRDGAVRTRAAVRSARDQGAAHHQTALDRAGQVSRLTGQVADIARQVEQLATDSQNQATRARSAADRAHSQTQASAQRIVGWISQKTLDLSETWDRLALRLRHAQDSADRIAGLARTATSEADQAQRDAIEAANRARAAVASQSRAIEQADLATASFELARAAAAAERQRAGSVRLEDAAMAQARATVAEFHAKVAERWASVAGDKKLLALGQSELASQAAVAAEHASAEAVAGATSARQQQESAQDQVERGGKALRELEEILRLMQEARDKLQGSTGHLSVEFASKSWAETQSLANLAMQEAARFEVAARAVDAAMASTAQETTATHKAALEARHALHRADEAAKATAAAAREAEEARQAAQKEQGDAAETARLDRELEVRRAIAAVDDLKKSVADKLGKPEQLKQLDVERTITFFSAAHLPLRDFGPGGEVYDQEGLVIYEDMQFTYRDNGEYSVHFKAGTPAVPVTLYLQILVRKAPDGPWHTISLEPLQLPVARSASGKPQRGVVVKHVTGHSSALARQPGKVCDIRRDASARFGFGIAALGHEER
ncbi:MAG: hypothetical protein J5I93_19215 [Pirellulaceae bacterium]|nr:hypothetical protein [Pirellulaceae bacterium]